jgi:DNA-directed RNA polymerase specialized sigma24 family protein
MEQTQTHYAETFLARTLRHREALYADALCLTGSQEDAADLVVEAYLRAFQEYGSSWSERVLFHLRKRGTLDWLCSSLHAAFCDRVQSRTQHDGTLIGGRP